MALQEPVPGQPLTATWGREVVRELRRNRLTGGTGFGFTRGANGTTLNIPGVKGAGGVTYATGAGLFPFRLGVGTETDRSGTAPVVRWHKVAVVPKVTVDGHEYAVANNAVESDSMLGGLPLPKAGSDLPWVWIKDAGLADITVETAQRTTANLYLHVDSSNMVCVLANTQALTATTYSKVVEGHVVTMPFVSDGHAEVGRFDQYESGRKPKVVGQYAVGSLAWMAKAASLPFALRVTDNGDGTETLVCYSPSVSVNGVDAVIDNDEHDTERGWYLPHVGEDVGDEFAVYCYRTSSDAIPHAILTTDATAPDGYDDDTKMEIGEVSVVEGKMRISAQRAVGGENDNESVRPFRVMWIDEGTGAQPLWRKAVYLPDGCVTRGGSFSTTWIQCVNQQVTGADGWRYVDETTGGEKIYLNATYYWYREKAAPHGTSLPYVRFTVTESGGSFPSTPTPPATHEIRSLTFSTVIGNIESGNLIEPFACSSVDYPETFQTVFVMAERALEQGGGGDTVNVDTGTLGSNNLLVRFKQKQDGTVTFETTPAIRAAEVQLGTQGQTDTLSSFFVQPASGGHLVDASKSTLGGDNGGKWVKTESDGTLATTDDTPAVVVGEEGGTPTGGKFVKSSVDASTGDAALEEQDCIRASDVGVGPDGASAESLVGLDDFFTQVQYGQGAVGMAVNADALAIPSSSVDNTKDRQLVVKAESQAVELVDAVTLTPKSGDIPAPVSGDPPKADKYSQNPDTDYSLIGTSQNAAREDHKHPIDTENGGSSEFKPSQPMASGDDEPTGYLPVPFALDTTTWSVNGSSGVKVPMLTRCFSYAASQVSTATKYRYFIFREFEWGRNGNLISVGAEYVGFRTRYS